MINKILQVKKEIHELRDDHGSIRRNRQDIFRVDENYYRDIYSSRRPHNKSPIQEQLRIRITNAYIGSKSSCQLNEKYLWEDGIVTEAIEAGGKSLQRPLRYLFSKCLEQRTIPKNWNNARITLLHMKRHIIKLKNYRHISLLTHVYKQLMKIVTKDGIRAGYGPNDSSQNNKILIEKCSLIAKKLSTQ